MPCKDGGAAALFSLPIAARPPGLTRVDDGSVQCGLDMRRVELLDHFDARAAVFGNSVDVCTFHEPKEDIGVT